MVLDKCLHTFMRQHIAHAVGTFNVGDIRKGARFIYNGVPFVKLADKHKGALCITTQPHSVTTFDNRTNRWEYSALREEIRTGTLSQLISKYDLLSFPTDMTADNGDINYGKCSDTIALPTADMFERYQNLMPLPARGNHIWTATPALCKSYNIALPPMVCVVDHDGHIAYSDITAQHYVYPVCVFHPEAQVY